MRIAKILLLAVALATSACVGSTNRATANLKGWSKVCVDGVSYLQFPSGATVQYDRDGKVVGCQ